MGPESSLPCSPEPAASTVQPLPPSFFKIHFKIGEISGSRGDEYEDSLLQSCAV
jgi:hypothetical protein